MAFASLFGATSAVLAADLPAPPPVYIRSLQSSTIGPASISAAIIGAAWSGLSGTNFSDPLGSTFKAPTNVQFIGGGQVGVNYEFWGGVVIGAEAMFDWLPNSQNASMTATAPDGTAAFVGTINNRWLTTATGRLGYAWDRVLLYGKGGGAWVATNSPSIAIGGGSPASFASVTNTNNFGYTAGFGLEWAFCGQLVGARRVRLHRIAQPELYGSAGDSNFRRRCHHIHLSKHLNHDRGRQLQIRRLVIVKLSRLKQFSLRH